MILINHTVVTFAQPNRDLKRFSKSVNYIGKHHLADLDIDVECFCFKNDENLVFYSRSASYVPAEMVPYWAVYVGHNDPEYHTAPRRCFVSVMTYDELMSFASSREQADRHFIAFARKTNKICPSRSHNYVFTKGASL